MSLPGINASKPAAVTVGGLKRFTLDLSVRLTWTRTCSFSEGKPDVNLFTDTRHGEGLDWGIAGNARMRLFVLDVGDGRVLVVDIEAQTKATWDALVPDAMPIVESFDFKH